MIFIVYSLHGSKSISSNVGLSEYSYYFVLKAYLPLLEELGEVVVVDNVLHEVDAIYDKALLKGKDSVFLSFTAPHNTELNLRCPTISVFAWEYSGIPDESWNGVPNNNWSYALSKIGAAITHSGFSVDAVKEATSPDFPVVSVPAPVWDSYNSIAPVLVSKTITLNANVFDSDKIIGDGLFNKDGSTNYDEFINDDIYDLSLSGVVYTSVFNPNDGRKNWKDMLTGFCYTFRKVPDATLLLKLSYFDAHVAYSGVLDELKRLLPFQCRIIIVHGYIEDNEFKELIANSNFIVNSSFGEGQCLPLMEFMSAGKPAIAPCHSAMRDYISASNSFVIKSSPEWIHWPHDPRIVFRTFRERISWESLCDQYQASYDVFVNEPAVYAGMSKESVKSLFDYCAKEKGLKTLATFFDQSPYKRPISKKLSVIIIMRSFLLRHKVNIFRSNLRIIYRRLVGKL